MDKAEVEAQLKKLYPNKSVELDGINRWLLKEVHAKLELLPSWLFQKSIETKVIPLD